MRSLLVSTERLRCFLTKPESLIRPYHCLETQRKRARDLTGKWDSILVISSGGICEFDINVDCAVQGRCLWKCLKEMAKLANDEKVRGNVMIEPVPPSDK